MSGFLHRLSARHSGVTSIRPRSRSRFESGPTGTTPAGTRLAPSGGWSDPSSECSLPAPQSDGPALRRRGSAFGGDAAADGAQDQPQGAAPAPAAAAATLPTQTTIAHTHRDEGVQERRTRAWRFDAVARGPGVLDLQPGARVPNDGNPAAGLRGARDAEDAHEGGGTLVPAPRSTAVHAPPAAVVQVHIGRVEVRAVMAAAERGTPRARRPATPPMSLDKYLSGDGRR